MEMKCMLRIAQFFLQQMILKLKLEELEKKVLLMKVWKREKQPSLAGKNKKFS